MRILAMAALLSLMCQNCSEKRTSAEVLNEDESYEIFSSRFDKDSIFQKSRMKYHFDRKVDLSVSHIDTSQFKIATIYGDSVIIKTTYRKDTTYWIEFIFKRAEGKWYFVNYIDSYDD